MAALDGELVALDPFSDGCVLSATVREGRGQGQVHRARDLGGHGEVETRARRGPRAS
jgi:hypothetical protein